MRRRIGFLLALTIGVLCCTTASALAEPDRLVGDSNIEIPAVVNAAGTPEASPFTAQYSGAADTIHFYLHSSNAATNVRVAIYDSDGSGGTPNSELASGSTSSLTGNAWNAASLSPPYTVTAGHRYWLAIMGTGGTLYTRGSAVPSCRSVFGPTGQMSLPNPWQVSSSTSPTCPLSIYASGPATAGHPIGLGERSTSFGDFTNQGDGNLGQARAFQYVAPESMSVDQLSVYFAPFNPGSYGESVGLYSDISGSPGALLTSGTIPAGSIARNWASVSVSPYGVTAGTRYWIAILNSASNAGSNYFVTNSDTSGDALSCPNAGSTGALEQISNATGQTSLPNPTWSTPGTTSPGSTCDLAAYASGLVTSTTTGASQSKSLASASTPDDYTLNNVSNNDGTYDTFHFQVYRPAGLAALATDLVPAVLLFNAGGVCGAQTYGQWRQLAEAKDFVFVDMIQPSDAAHAPACSWNKQWVNSGSGVKDSAKPNDEATYSRCSIRSPVARPPPPRHLTSA
jgi:hypothetical protein